MRNADQSLRPLRNGSAPKAGGTVFCDHIIRVSPLDGYCRSRSQHGGYPGDPAVSGGGGHGDNAPSSPRPEGPHGEVHGPAGSGILQGADGFGADLPGQIHRQRRIHGHQIVILPDDAGVVDETAGFDADVLPAVYEIIEFPASPYESHHRFSRQKILPRISDHTSLDETAQTVPQHFRMNAQVPFLHQCITDGLRQPSDSELDRIAVVNEGRHPPGDRPVRLPRQRHRVIENRRIRENISVQILHVDFRCTENPGNMGIQFQNSDLRRPEILQFCLQAGGQPQGAVFLRQGGCAEIDIRRPPGHLFFSQITQVVRQECPGPFLHAPAHLGTVEDAVKPERVPVCRIRNKGIIFPQETGPQGHIPDPAAYFMETAEYLLRFRRVHSCSNEIPGLDMVQCLINGDLTSVSAHYLFHLLPFPVPIRSPSRTGVSSPAADARRIAGSSSALPAGSRTIMVDPP